MPDRPTPSFDEYAPGTAEVAAKIESVHPAAERALIRISVDSVLGYGAAAPPIATGRHIEVTADRFEPDSLSGKTIPGAGEPAIFLIRAVPSVKDSNRTYSWSLVRIKDLKIE